MPDESAKQFRGAIPMLVCADPAAEIEFCKAVFGAEELSRRTGPDGAVIHALLKIGATLAMVHGVVPHLASRAPELDGSSPVVIYNYVSDADACIEKAVGAGARVLMPVANMPWGDRVGRILSPSGHVWNIASR